MALEKFIRGKVDSCHHDGRAANTRRLQESEANLQEFLSGEVTMQPAVEYPVNRINHQDNLSRLHGYFYKGTYYHHGVGQQPKDNPLSPTNKNK